MNHEPMQRKSLASIVWIPIIAAVLTIFIKSAAYYITGSVGFMSDAMESVINLIASIVAFISLTIAAQPADKKHPFGHDKAEYFSSLTEGLLITIASFGIAYTAINRIYHPQPLEALNIGMVLSLVATLINFGVALFLLRFGRKHNSITLEADGHHLMTDVYTTVGIVVGIFLVKLTNWQLLDPIMAIIVSVSILYTGVKLIVRSTDGLMDQKLSEKDMILIKQILDKHKAQGVDYHALYTRQSSSKRFITFHLLFPENITLSKAHEISKAVEIEITEKIPNSDIFIHMEPINDPDAYDDVLCNCK
jgi:cation diffusion facilitator family transporter